MSRHPIPHVNTVSFGFHVGTGCPKTMEAADQHNEIELNFIEQGELVLRRGEETVALRPGDGMIYWAAVPHQVLAVEPDTQLIWIILPLSWFLAWGLGTTFTRRLLEGGVLPVTPDGGSPETGDRHRRRTVFSFANWSRDFASGSSRRKMIVRLELEAFFRRLAADWDAGEAKKSPPPSENRRQPQVSAFAESITAEHQCSHVERMVRYINGHFHEPITMEMIARDAKLNPEYAMRLFRKRWGMTLGHFLLQQRISEARRLLLLSDMPLVEVALSSGFQSVSRFYEAFKTECECSPGVYRRRHVIKND